MKKFIYALLSVILMLILSMFNVKAQQAATEGEVSYTETIKININFEGMTEQMKERMPKERKSNQILYFNQEASSYQASKEQADENVPGQKRGRGMRMMMMGGSNPDNKVYLNYKDKLKIEQKEFMTRVFLIKGEVNQGNWKLTTNQKMILDYPCQEATQIIEKDTISAWFTPVIPVSAGPSNYVNLPGLVLEVNINNGQRMIVASKIDLKPIAKDLISKPRKGKKVSREEYKKIVEKKLKEMGVESGNGSGTRVMRFIRH